MLLLFVLLHWRLRFLVEVSGQALEGWCLLPLAEQLGRGRSIWLLKCAVTRKSPSTILGLRSPALGISGGKCQWQGRQATVPNNYLVFKEPRI